MKVATRRPDGRRDLLFSGESSRHPGGIPQSFRNFVQNLCSADRRRAGDAGCGPGAAGPRDAYLFFSTSRVGVSGVSPPRRRAKVSLPLSSQVPSTARRANTSQAASQSPSE